MLKISYILPCYNVERYIEDCLDSIYAQNLLEDEFEVICVNDCSTDKTQSIIVDYSKRHDNLMLINHTENLTAGGARNTGIRAASGEYIWFVDPDDLIRPDDISGMLTKMKAENLDIFLFNFEDLDERLNHIKDECVLSDSEILSGQDYILSMFDGNLRLLGIVWRCLYSTSFLKENKLSFPLIRKSQDVVFSWNALLKASKVQSTRNVYYSFRVNPYSVTHIPYNATVVFSERILFGNEIIRIIENSSYNLSHKIYRYMQDTCYWCANTNVDVIAYLSKEERILYYELMKCNKLSLKKIFRYANWKNKSVLWLGLGCFEWRIRIQVILFFVICHGN